VSGIRGEGERVGADPVHRLRYDESEVERDADRKGAVEAGRQVVVMAAPAVGVAVVRVIVPVRMPVPVPVPVVHVIVRDMVGTGSVCLWSGHLGLLRLRGHRARAVGNDGNIPRRAAQGCTVAAAPSR
jgi:hypothetical protein